MNDNSRALFQFHWRSGARVALRANAAGLGIVVFLFGSTPGPDALGTIRRFLLGLVSVTPTNGPRTILAVIALGLAATAAPRVTLGGAGWMRSLPIDARASRRAAIAAIAVAQALVPIGVLIACALALLLYRAPLSWSRIVAVAPMLVAIAGIVLRRQSVSARAVYVVAAMSAVVGTSPALFASLGLIAAAERFAGDAEPVALRFRLGRARNPTSWAPRSALVQWTFASWRAIGPRRIVDGFAAGVIPLAFAYFIVKNNADIAPGIVSQVVRVCDASAVVAVAASVAHSLLRRRRPWPWARSLPWSSSQRITVDAIVIGVPVFVAAIVLMPLSVIDSLSLVAVVPCVAIVAAASVRMGATRTYGAAGRCVMIAAPIATAVVLWPVLALLALAAVPIAHRWAARLDVDTRATAWVELQHDAAGDPYWLSRS